MREELNLALGTLDEIINQPDSKENELNLITQMMLQYIRDNDCKSIVFKLTGHGDNSFLFDLINSYMIKYDLEYHFFHILLNHEIKKYIPTDVVLMSYNNEYSLLIGPINMDKENKHDYEKSFQNLSNEILAPFQLQIRKYDCLIEKFIYNFFFSAEYAKNMSDHKMETLICEIECVSRDAINAYYFYTVFTILQELKEKYADKMVITFSDHLIEIYSNLQDIIKRVNHIKPELVLIFGFIHPCEEENKMTIERKDL